MVKFPSLVVFPAPEHVRAARAWLGMTQDEFVTAANAVAPDARISKRTLIRVERGGTLPYDDTLVRFGNALHALGIEPVFEGSVPMGIRVIKR